MARPPYVAKQPQVIDNALSAGIMGKQTANIQYSSEIEAICHDLVAKLPSSGQRAQFVAQSPPATNNIIDC